MFTGDPGRQALCGKLRFAMARRDAEDQLPTGAAVGVLHLARKQPLQFLRDGPRLAGGGVASAEDFEAIPDAAPAEGAAPMQMQAGATTGGNPDPFA